ncbi:hypothetical protein F8388_020759 [Cannabis sativa]|uniref:Uncharacterized protein n=1 Tax=Cannabis sativa TaxID=3483 RepID=A0A7J6EZV6_CANSA|nr:hypothetical protein F8388_020759 [Cannabis sativa]KAF4396090.1 hypothetical protein G4B88_020727 [Cannabis sativa]
MPHPRLDASGLQVFGETRLFSHTDDLTVCKATVKRCMGCRESSEAMPCNCTVSEAHLSPTEKTNTLLILAALFLSPPQRVVLHSHLPSIFHVLPQSSPKHRSLLHLLLLLSHRLLPLATTSGGAGQSTKNHWWWSVASSGLGFRFYSSDLRLVIRPLILFLLTTRFASRELGMATGEHAESSNVKAELCQTLEIWKQEMEEQGSQVDLLQSKFMDVKANVKESEEESKKELDVLWHRVKTTTTLLTYLKYKARIMAVPHLAQTYCGIEQLEGVGLVDKNGTPLSDWSKDVDASSFNCLDDETCTEIGQLHGSLDVQDEAYISDMLKSVKMVAKVMEYLVERVLLAESETAIEKDKVTSGQEEIERKSVQIEEMSLKLEEMKMFALGTNSILNEMRQSIDDLVEETSRQRQRASENEQELCRVKREFESLKSYVSTLITVRETLVSSEKQFQTIEKLFERLVVKTTQLEGEKVQKEVEVQKLMEENDRLTALLDKKEAQLLAMNEQCKVMALSGSNI